MSSTNHVPLSLPLKTKDTLLGRLQNMRFLALEVFFAVFRYYWRGPEVDSWDLRFHIIYSAMRQYLAKSLPHDMPNEISARINFEDIADYISINNPPLYPLLPKVGINAEHTISLGLDGSVQYSVPQYRLSNEKLNALAAADLDSAQQGQPRSISCQIVVSTHAECSEQHKFCELLALTPLEPDERIVLHFHGGAYCVGERSLTHLQVYANMSRTTHLRIFSPNYRLAPRHCFPSQLHDCFSTYWAILRRGFKPKNIVLSGDSAGGALALGVMFLLRDMKQPLPATAVLVSPWVDSTCSGKSWVTNQQLDYLPSLSLQDPFHPARMFYAPGRPYSEEMLEELKCPLVSPIFGDLSGIPPMLIQMGRNELLHDDIHDFAVMAKLQNDNDHVKLEVYDNMPHVFLLFDFADAAQKAFASIGDYVRASFKHNTP
ncbi:hypothetical protein GGF46_003473 [Coemansia sp. RSA 552]|nr:hypothetical protein GGF46_003473 [Coemansia sp. RSA 552]